MKAINSLIRRTNRPTPGPNRAVYASVKFKVQFLFVRKISFLNFRNALETQFDRISLKLVYDEFNAERLFVTASVLFSV